MVGKTGTGMSRKPEKTTEENKKKRLRKRKTKQTLTRAVTHIRLELGRILANWQHWIR